jgi:RNA polymerase sigma-70 factor, ECF subfamily
VTMSRFEERSVILCMERNLEVALVVRLRAGDTTAFDEIYDTLNPRLLSFLRRMARNQAVAEDLAEETWLRLVQTREDLQADTRLVPWLFTVARNLFLSYCRSRAREQAYTSDLISLWPDVLAGSPFDIASTNEFERSLEAALGELPTTYREVLLLVGVEGLRPADAAMVCGISGEALRQRLSRARLLLSQRLQEKGLSPETISKEVSL